jgi:hypothetical protein
MRASRGARRSAREVHVAEIDVVRKKRSATMYWILAGVILAVLAWWLVARSETNESGSRSIQVPSSAIA